MEIRTKFMRKSPKIIIIITEGGREHSNKSTQEKGKAKPQRVPPAHSGKGEAVILERAVWHMTILQGSLLQSGHVSRANKAPRQVCLFPFQPDFCRNTPACRSRGT